MARTYRRVADGLERTWTGTVEGHELVVTTTTGRRSRTRRSRFPSAEVALAQLDAALAQMRDGGWEEVVESVVVDRDAVDPDLLPSMLVLADHLTEAGDPRGELLLVQVRLEADPTLALAEHEAALLARHGEDWTGPIPDGVELVWRRGFVASVHAVDTDGTELAAFLEGLVERGSARFLRELTVTGDRPREAVAEVLATRSWPWLTDLHLEGRGALRRPLESLLRTQPALVRLGLRFAAVQSGELQAGRLDRLSIAVDSLRMEDLSGLSLIGLRVFELRVGEPWEADRGALQRLIHGVPELVLAGGAVTEWLEGLTEVPRAERILLRDCTRAGDVGWLLEQQAELLRDRPITVERIELSDADVGRLEGLHLVLPLPDVAVQRGVDRSSPRQEAWRRFERAKKERFWAVVREGAELVVHYGKIGSPGRTVRRSFDSVQAAAAEYRRRVNRKVAEGWTETTST